MIPSLTVSIVHLLTVISCNHAAARLLPEDLRSQSLPQPIILDAYLRFRTDCKLLGNFHRGTGLQPWIFCSSTDTPGMNDRKLALIEAGALVFCVSCQDGGDFHGLHSHMLSYTIRTAVHSTGSQRII